MTAPVLALAGVGVDRAEVPVVHDVTLDAAPGAVTVILGANGAKKTTLMDGIAGLAAVKSGTIRLDGTPIESSPPTSGPARASATSSRPAPRSGR